MLNVDKTVPYGQYSMMEESNDVSERFNGIHKQ